MEILLLCGVFEKKHEEEIMKDAKKPVEFSANIFQEKLIQGFMKNNYDFHVLSAPFIGSYPNASNKIYFPNISSEDSEYEYIAFNNVWGIRNFSRENGLKKSIKKFVKLNDDNKLIVVYSPHTPFLQAAVYAKKKDPRIKICMVIPDLPQFMNLSEKVSLAYKVGKKFDIASFYRLNKEVDSYVILTEQMRDPLNIQEKPYMVVEGLIDYTSNNSEQNISKKKNESLETVNIVYTGKLNKKFGVIDLVDSFLTSDEENYRLILCGKGDAEKYIKEKSETDGRIVFLGQVSPEKAKEWMKVADVLINPRKNDEEYTKYSFPSKNIEYLLTGNEVVGYRLDGIPTQYEKYMHFIEGDEIFNTVRIALNYKKNQGFLDYAKDNLDSKSVARRIVEMSI